MSTGQLTVNLAALANNWRYLRSQLKSTCECAAVVKANAYGVGAKQAVELLQKAGCSHFFVASLQEALEIKPVLAAQTRLFVLSGCRQGEEAIFVEHDIVPVLISLPMFERWLQAGQSAVCAIKINTGMGRLGLQLNEFESLLNREHDIKQVKIKWLMSHLACADVPEHPLNARQLTGFKMAAKKLQEMLPEVRLSLCNSAGIFLGENFHFDLVRPGIALYGGQPQIISRDLQPVVTLKLEVLQSRLLPAGEAVGYGAEYKAQSPKVLVTASAGYADGIFRALGGKARGAFKGHFFPQVGRISMDSVVFDVSDLPEGLRPQEGDLIEILGENISVDELASKADTISYEILTSLGVRYSRSYID